ncbi:hypothetical protein RND71_028197 [Anisodus tanguticus]|uniref:Transposase-associated domain-containing protein n=1 Tax=Anisodus tanguticus TaxID=243964 RepID=A0AAE1RI10_9SOLA|nr:hypothetical protein RND71_028197 [Anisodus tanguticus]
MESRSWMDDRNHIGRREMKAEFVDGVKAFVDYAMTLEPFLIDGLVRCPCEKCHRRNYEEPRDC